MDWGAWFSIFGLIFVAELGDKTQLAVVTQTCRYRQPWPVFLGASLALTMVTVLGAIGGQLIRRIVPENVLHDIAALAFVVMGVLAAWEAAKARTGASAREVTRDCVDDASKESPSALTSAWDWQAFGSTLGLLFVAELGDKTQLVVFSLAGKCESIWPVLLGGTMALISVTALGVIGGQGLCKLVPERLLLWISAVVFVVVGALMGLGKL